MSFLSKIGKSFSSAVHAVGHAVSSVGKEVGKVAGGIADGFAKIGGGLLSGGLGGLLGGPLGAIGSKLLGSIAGGGALPLPKGFGGLLSQLPSLIQKGLGNIAALANKFLGDQIGIKNPFGKALDLIGKLLKKFPDVAVTPSPAGPIPIPYPNVGGTDGAKPKGDSLLDAAGKAFDQLGGIEKEIQSLNPDDKDYQKKLMMLQQKMMKLNEMIQLINQMMRMKHEMATQVIQNIRA